MLGFVNIYIITKIAKDLASEREKRIRGKFSSLFAIRFDDDRDIYMYIYIEIDTITGLSRVAEFLFFFLIKNLVLSFVLVR